MWRGMFILSAGQLCLMDSTNGALMLIMGLVASRSGIVFQFSKPVLSAHLPQTYPC